MPCYIELGKIGPYFVVNIFDKKQSDLEFLAGEVSTGMNEIAEVAWLKGINEWIERKAFLENKDRTPNRFVRESDGCAAFPHFIIGKKTAESRARTNAFNEALERFVWSKWWDQNSSADIKILDKTSLYMITLTSVLESKIVPEKLYVIVPKFLGYSEKIVIVLILSLSGGGFISGGAGGEKNQTKATFERAFVELLRHSLGYCRMLNSSTSPISFYDRRLSFFARGCGDHLVWERISSKSDKVVEFSDIEYDSVLDHSLQDISTVYHVQFKEPPYFLEGPLDRLCL